MRERCSLFVAWPRPAVVIAVVAGILTVCGSDTARANDGQAWDGPASTSVIKANADTKTAQTPVAAVPAPTVTKRLIEFGIEERIRNEHYNDITDFNAAKLDERNQYRFRTRVWLRIPFSSRVELYTGLNNESRKISVPDTTFIWDEIIFETLWLGVKVNESGMLRVGRQNIMRGDGFIFFDGNALDGSRDAYFNALTYLHSFNKGQTTFEAMAVSDPYRDKYLPVFNAKDKNLTEWDEAFVGAYVTDKRNPKTEVQAYAFHKTERHDFRVVTHPQHQSDKTIETIGGRIARKLPAEVFATGEFAVQWGSLEAGPSVRGWGGQAYVRKSFAHAWKPVLSVGYVGLSGDDPSSSTLEGWTPVASRWPKWSELYIYSLASERGAAYWTNLGMWQVEATAAPSRRLGLRATYYHMSAYHPFAGSPAVFAKGTTRGDLLQVRADVTLSSALKGHLLYESHEPGSFYTGQDRGYFFRWEVSYAFTRKAPMPGQH
jgi:hypothetical protein